MWTKEEIVISLKYDKVPKWQIAPFLRLDKPWNCYNRLEFAEIASVEANQSQELNSLLIERRAQRTAYDRLLGLYLKDQNTLPSINLDGSNDWVSRLAEYESRRISQPPP